MRRQTHGSIASSARTPGPPKIFGSLPRHDQVLGLSPAIMPAFPSAAQSTEAGRGLPHRRQRANNVNSDRGRPPGQVGRPEATAAFWWQTCPLGPSQQQ